MAEECVSLIPGIKELLADKAYDTNAIRAFLKERGIKAVIPSKSNRKKKIRHDKQAYKARNVVERCFCRLKDWRRIATRYDKLAQNFFSACCFVAIPRLIDVPKQRLGKVAESDSCVRHDSGWLPHRG